MKLILTIIFIMTVSLFGQETGYMENSDYTGGLNLTSDSANLKPNQAITADNVVFNKYGSIEKRPGIKYWNRNQTTGSDVIKDIFYFTTTAGTKKTMIASQNWLYAKNSTDTTTITDWAAQRVKYSKGSISVTNGSKVVTGRATWWLLGIKEGDYFYFKTGFFGNGNGTAYVIDTIRTDSSLVLTQAYGYFTDTGSYEIVRNLDNSQNNIVSWNNNAYVASSKVPAFYYDSSDCRWLACIDSGQLSMGVGVVPDAQISYEITSAFYSCVRYSRGNYQLVNEAYFNVDSANNVYGNAVKDSMGKGYVFNLTHVDPLSSSNSLISRTILSIDSINSSTWRIMLNSGYPRNLATTNVYSDSAFMTSSQSSNFQDGDYYFVQDSTKIFSNTYVGCIFVSGVLPRVPLVITETGGGNLTIRRTTNDSVSAIAENTRYYIFSSIPYTKKLNSMGYYSPIFEQIFFHDNILFAFGHQLDSLGDTINQGFIYHSDIGLPKQLRTISEDGLTIELCGFDVSFNPDDKPTSLFELHDRLIISTQNKIYALMGYPPAIGDGNLINVLPNMGIPSYNAVVTRDNNYAYLANTQGFYTFDGNGVDKISLAVEPLVKQYLTSDYELGYFNDNVYFSFNDSNYTLLYHEPTKGFSRLNFGIEAMNHQTVASDSGYFLFAHHTLGARRIFKYPMDTQYVDSLSPSSSTPITIKYKTGWMALDGISWNKMFKAFYVTLARYNDNIYFRFRTNFDTTTVQSILFDTPSCDNCQYLTSKRLQLSQLLQGRYIQLEVSGSTSNYFSLGRYGLEWERRSNY